MAAELPLDIKHSSNLELDRYIPLSRTAAIDLCTDLFADGEQAQFRRFANMLSAWYHYTYHADLERLKERFESASDDFASELNQVAQAANFNQIERADLDLALSEESVFRLRLAVNFDDFEQIVFYRRGASIQSALVPKWFGLSKRSIDFTNFEHVLVYVRFKDASAFDMGDPPPFTPGSSMLKLFANVPKADLEMLFPNTQVRMRLIDKLFIGVPAFISGVVVLSTKIGATALVLVSVFAFWLGMSNERVELDQAGLIALLSAAGALGAYLWKQYNNFKNRKIRFMKALAENLYFKTLANDAGVLSYLIDRAEESECKEVLLAYTQLHIAGPQSKAALSAALQTLLDNAVEFDTEDALQKLHHLGLIVEDGESINAIPLAQACATVDTAWDNVFTSP